MAIRTMRSRTVNSRNLFFITSPRTPFKAVPEIALLDEELHGEIWNKETQKKFYHILKERDFFEGSEAKNADFAARDRVNRLPHKMGFVRLPEISLTEAGKEFIESDNKEEILLRQMLKYQIPSPLQPLGDNAADFKVKPYLELFRLIRELGSLSFDELQIYGMQLVNYEHFDEIVAKIKKFRKKKETYNGNYSELRQNELEQETRSIYSIEIATGKIHTRETKTSTVTEFIAKKIRNLRDYADAAVRNLRSTGLVNVTAIGKTMSILPEREKDVDYFLATIDRNPIYVNQFHQYENYLGNASLPVLLTDDKDQIIETLHTEFGISAEPSLSINRLKDTLYKQRGKRRKEKIEKQVKDLKDYKLYDDIISTFDKMGKSYEPSLFFEWNTWRAITMLDGGIIQANLKFDDSGNPMSTALGKMADIECDYGDFDMIVEVSLSSGALQFKMEGEPVPRHIGIHKSKVNKPTYCLFIAPTINPATVAHFYSLYHLNINMYGGKCNIIPLTLDTFRKMLKDAVEASSKPNASNIKKLFELSLQYAQESNANDGTETDWFNRITEAAANWLAA